MRACGAGVVPPTSARSAFEPAAWPGDVER